VDPDFSAAEIEKKKVRKLREQIRYSDEQITKNEEGGEGETYRGKHRGT
jgi:hypothetical protein